MLASNKYQLTSHYIATSFTSYSHEHAQNTPQLEVASAATKSGHHFRSMIIPQVFCWYTLYTHVPPHSSTEFSMAQGPVGSSLIWSTGTPMLSTRTGSGYTWGSKVRGQRPPIHLRQTHKTTQLYFVFNSVYSSLQSLYPSHFNFLADITHGTCKRFHYHQPHQREHAVLVPPWQGLVRSVGHRLGDWSQPDAGLSPHSHGSGHWSVLSVRGWGERVE